MWRVTVWLYIADALRPGDRKTRFSVDSFRRHANLSPHFFFFQVRFCKASMASPLENDDEGVSLEARCLMT